MTNLSKFEKLGIQRSLLPWRDGVDYTYIVTIDCLIWMINIRAPRFADWLRKRYNVAETPYEHFIRQLHRKWYQELLLEQRKEHRRQMARPFTWLYSQLKRPRG